MRRVEGRGVLSSCVVHGISLGDSGEWLEGLLVGKLRCHRGLRWEIMCRNWNSSVMVWQSAAHFMYVVRINVWRLFLLLVWLLLLLLMLLEGILLLLLLLLMLWIKVLLLWVLLVRILLLLVLLVMGLLLLLMWLEGVCLSHILRPRFFVILWHWLFLAHFLLLVAFDFLLAIFVSLGRRFLLREFDRLREVDDVLVFGRRDLLLNRLCNFFGFSCRCMMTCMPLFIL